MPAHWRAKAWVDDGRSEIDPIPIGFFFSSNTVLIDFVSVNFFVGFFKMHLRRIYFPRVVVTRVFAVPIRVSRSPAEFIFCVFVGFTV